MDNKWDGSHGGRRFEFTSWVGEKFLALAPVPKKRGFGSAKHQQQVLSYQRG
jgi:hypothetical protein